LQQRIETTTQENERLQEQATALREEIINLKTLLLAHKDCPVAKANGVNGLDIISTNTMSAPSAVPINPSANFDHVLMNAGIVNAMPPTSSLPLGSAPMSGQVASRLPPHHNHHPNAHAMHLQRHGAILGPTPPHLAHHSSTTAMPNHRR
jgi:hypothetical protein